MGIGLSASAGFRVFVPLLVAGIGGRFGWVPLTEHFHWLGEWPALVCFGTATVIEIFAYYIPVVDNLLDTITTPLAILAGTLLATSVLPIDQELWKWGAGLIVGGGSAAIIQSGTALLRLFTTKATVGTGNAMVATGENLGAWTLSSLSLVIPVLVAVVVVIMIGVVLMGLARRKKSPS
jgi:hypothetical protein